MLSWRDWISTRTYICFFSSPPGLSTTTRAATERVSGFTSGAILSTVPAKAVAPAVDLGAVADLDGTSRSESKICAITQTRERSATVKQGVVPACSKLSGRDQLFHHGAGDRRADHAFDARHAAFPPCMSLMVCGSMLRASKRLQGGVAVGFGVGGVGLGLLRFALRDAVVLEHRSLSHVGEPARVGRGGERPCDRR